MGAEENAQTRRHFFIPLTNLPQIHVVELTQNYLRLYLSHIADDTPDPRSPLGAQDQARSQRGLLIHCISGKSDQLVVNWLAEGGFSPHWVDQLTFASCLFP